LKASERLLSADTHSNTANYKYTYSTEIVPICKDDLVCMPSKLARQLGNINPLTVCTRVGNSIHLVDPSTLQTCEITAPTYWRTPFEALASVSDLVEFTILDIEPSGGARGKWVLADAQIATSGAFRSSGAQNDGMMDYETSSTPSQVFHTRTHLVLSCSLATQLWVSFSAIPTSTQTTLPACRRTAYPILFWLRNRTQTDEEK